MVKATLISLAFSVFGLAKGVFRTRAGRVGSIGFLFFLLVAAPLFINTDEADASHYVVCRFSDDSFSVISQQCPSGANTVTAVHHGDLIRNKVCSRNGEPDYVIVSANDPCPSDHPTPEIEYAGTPDGGGPGPDPDSGGEPIQTDCNAPDGNVTSSNCGALATIATIANVLAGIVGVVVVIMVVVGGIQYTVARDNPQAVAAARGRVFNALLALVSLLAAWAFLNWIIPGGLL